MKISFNITILLKKIFIKIFYFLLAIEAMSVIGMGYYYVISPRQKDIDEGGSISLEAKKKQLDELTLYIGKIKYMSDQYRGYSIEKINTLSSILPRDKDIPGLFVQMQEIAKKNNFALNSMDISDLSNSENTQKNTENSSENQGENNTAANDNKLKQKTVEDSSGIKELNVSFIITGGNYDNLKSFLSDIEKNLRLFDIYDINFGSTKEGPYSMNLRTYYISP